MVSPPPDISARDAAAPPRTARAPRWLQGAALLGLAAVLAGGVFLAWDLIEWQKLRLAIQDLNTPLTLLLMATLPIGGFSMAVVHVLAGAKFGPWLGLLVVAGATACHLLGTHWIARSALRGPLERWFARHRTRFPTIPPQDDVAVSVLVALIPGPPYFLRNYFLALAGVPLRIYFWTCLPVYVAHGCVAIFLGDLGADPGRGKVALIVAVYLVKLGVCAEVLRRLRKRHARSRAAAAKLP